MTAADALTLFYVWPCAGVAVIVLALCALAGVVLTVGMTEIDQGAPAP